MPALAPVDFLAAVVAIYATTVLGFAGALQELGLPRQAFVTWLVGFNVGVEGGQLAVIGAAFLTVGRFRRRPWYRRCVVIPASAMIAATALCWTAQRIVRGG